MGVGKTSVGTELARLLDRPFLDSDAQIEQEEGLTSGEIADHSGVAALHELETSTFLDQARQPNACVIAAASSVVDFQAAREVLARTITIRLTANHDETVRRMRLGGHRRDVSEADAGALNRRRAPFLAEVAVMTVDTTGVPVSETAQRIVRQLEDSGFDS